MFELWLSSAHTESRPFQLLTLSHQWGGRGCTRSWEGTQPGQLTPPQQRDIPCRMASHSAYKLGGKLTGGCCSGTGWASVGWWWAVVFHLHHLFFLGFISVSFCYYPFH